MEVHAGASSLPRVSMQRSHFTAWRTSWLDCMTSEGQACAQLAPHMIHCLPSPIGHFFAESLLDLLEIVDALLGFQTKHLAPYGGMVSLSRAL